MYWARYLKEGRPIAYAVDSRGYIVRRYSVPLSRAESAVAHLWEYLDVVDPRPRLTLVKVSLPSLERRSLVEVFDPYNAPPLPGPRRHF